MSPEEKLFHQYSYLAKKTLHKAYKLPRFVAKCHKIEYEDLMQYALTGLFIACKNYDESKNVKFKSFAISNIRWHLSKQLVKDCHFKRTKYDSDTEQVNILSMDYSADPSDDKNFHEIVGLEYNLEEQALGKIAKDFIDNHLDNTQKEVLKLRGLGYTLRDIDEKLGFRKYKTQYIVEKIKKKLSILMEAELV